MLYKLHLTTVDGELIESYFVAYDLPCDFVANNIGLFAGATATPSIYDLVVPTVRYELGTDIVDEIRRLKTREFEKAEIARLDAVYGKPATKAATKKASK